MMPAQLLKEPTTRHRPPGRRPPTIQLTCIEDLDELRPRRAEWNSLVTRSDDSSIFQTFEWHTNWWKAFGGSSRPMILLAEKDGEMVGIAPLMLSRKWVLGRKRRVVEFIGAYSSDYCGFIIDQAEPEALVSMLQWLAAHDDQWDLLHLFDVQDTGTLRVLPAFLEQRGYAVDVRLMYEALTRVMGDPVADRKVTRKKGLVRSHNYFRRQGQLEFRRCTTTRDIEDHMDTFLNQHIRRWSLTDTPSQFLDERQRTFYRQMVRALCPAGWLVLFVALFNETPIAFRLCLEYANRIMDYKSSFDVDYRKRGPGNVLIKHILDYALERELTEVDFGVGEEPYKYRFTNHARLNYSVRVFRHRLPCYLDRLLLDGKDWAKRLTNRFPACAHIAYRLLWRWREHFDG